MRRIALILGTRPEAIKLAPIILALRQEPKLATHVCVTGQHREMLDQVLQVFGIVPDVDLALMQPGQSLAAITSRAVLAVDGYLSEHNPDLVLVQGDTTTVLCASLAAFYRRIPVGHVEAGLRTGNKHAPFPEEINRVLTTSVADYHFAPTDWARDNLLRAGVASDRIWVTGNPVVDALHIARARVEREMPAIPELPAELLGPQAQRRLVLITGHRRENFGPGFAAICEAIGRLAQRFEDTDFVYPVHLNPNVREPVFRLLNGRPNVHLIEPLSYLPFVALMSRCTLVLTDSGGVQEEAPSFGKPVLVMRETTERPEGVQAGIVQLVGANTDRIVDAASHLLTDERHYAEMARTANPYGDGRAAARIVEVCRHVLGVGDELCN